MTVIFISEFMQINGAENARSFVRLNASNRTVERKRETRWSARNFRAGDFNRDSAFLLRISMSPSR